jgi:hypothetical protein
MHALLAVIAVCLRGVRRAGPVLAVGTFLVASLVLVGCRQVLGIHDLDDPGAAAVDGGSNSDAADAGSHADSGSTRDGASPVDGGSRTDGSAQTGGDAEAGDGLDGAADSDGGGSDAGADGADADAGPVQVLAASLTASASLDLGMATVGQTAPTGQVQIKNTGNAATAPLATNITGAAFSIVNNGCKGVVLQPALSCIVTVAVQTTDAGSPSGALQVVDTTSDQVTVMLTATIVTRGALSVSPSSQNFADTPMGSTSTPLTFVVSNTGGLPTGTITASFGGTNASEFTMADGCTGKTLGPTDTCSIDVTFAPMTAGPKTASLGVSANPGGTGTASLTGRGQAPASLSIAPGSNTFSTFQIFAPPSPLPTATFVVSNSGDLPSGTLATTLSLASGTGSTEFKVFSDSCNGQPLAGMSTCTVVVQFNPTTHGAKSGSIRINPGALSASFTGTAADELALTVTKNGNGTGTVTDGSGLINCGSTCTAEVTRTTTNPVVTLTESPGPLTVFGGWNGGGCSGTATTCQVTLSAATTVNAQFNPQQTTLTVKFHGIGSQTASIASSPSGFGCSGNCTTTGTVNVGSTITLTVTQSAAAQIAWSNGCSGTSCVVTATAAPMTVNVTSTNQNVVFLTSQRHDGNFGGLSGANGFCNTAAASAGVPGNFVAFLGTAAGAGTPPYAQLGSARGWIRLDGLPFTDTVSAFQNNQIMWYPACLDEFGNTGATAYFTGKVNPLETTGSTCSDWTTGASSVTAIGGQGGEGSYFDSFWSMPCDGYSMGYSIACFGTDFTNPVSVSPASGRHAFIPSVTWVPSGGIAGADALCQSTAQTAGLANPANFKAALATTTTSIASRFNLSGANWVRVDGVPLAASTTDFMAGNLIAPPYTDEHGQPSKYGAYLGAANGTGAVAASTGDTCNDWSTNATASNALVLYPGFGRPGESNPFDSFSYASCGVAVSVFCLEN